MIPEDFAQRMQTLLGQPLAAATFATMREPKAIGLWENPLAVRELAEPQDSAAGVGVRSGLAVPELCVALGLPAPAPTGLAGCWRVEHSAREVIMHHPAVSAGSIYPINPSSLFAARALDVQPGDEVLDLAAAPGGKSLVMAAALTHQGGASGRLALVEPVKPRFHRLRANMQRCGVLQADYYQRDGRGVGTAVPERFDRVLLDAPCSSEARFHESEPSSFTHWNLKKVRDCARKQKSLLRSAFRALKPGGTLVYCTCSFAPEENERIVAGLLRREPTAQLVPVPVADSMLDRVMPGLQEWNGKELHCELALRVLPDDLWDGFFLARIIKVPEETHGS